MPDFPFYLSRVLDRLLDFIIEKPAIAASQIVKLFLNRSFRYA